MASPQHYCLRWNNYQSNLTSVFDQLLQSESFVDVTLAVAGRSLKAHKVILSACSPYFQTMLRDNPCQHPIVILNDVSYANMHAVVQFMYKGEISVAEQQLPSLLKVAEALKIRGLADVPEGGLGRASPDAAASPTAEASYSPRGMGTPELIESCVDVAALSPASGTASPLVSRPQEAADIRPAIAEMIKDEERAKMLENAASWNASPEVTFQHQLQAAWQKSWNQKQSLMQNLRFRERGSIKSWRPETMADAIMSVLREGHTLSQAARKYDIPYPTFVLYANRVHNLLGPSVEGPGCTLNEMRPKGRGRPQRILLGSWPDDTVKNVIRAVVFRDTSGLKEQQMEEANAAAAAAAAAAGIARNNESPSRGPPMPPMPPAQQNGRPQFPITSAAMARPAIETGPRGPPPGPPGPPRPPGPHAQYGVAYRPPPPVAPPRGQMPNLLGFPDIHMMMGMFPPGMMSSTGAVPTINLPPLADLQQSVAPASRSPPGRPVPPLSSIGRTPSDSSPDRVSAEPPTETPPVKMDTGEPTEPPSQAQQQKPPTQPPQGEEAPCRQPPPPPRMSQAHQQKPPTQPPQGEEAPCRQPPMSQAQSQTPPMSQAQSQMPPMSQAQSQMPPMSLAQPQMRPMSQAQSQMPPMSLAQPQMRPMSLAQPQTRPMSQAQPQMRPMSQVQSQMRPMSQTQPPPPMPQAQPQMRPMPQTQPQMRPMSQAQPPPPPMSQAQSQMQSPQAQLARMMPQLPPLQPDSPPGGAGGGGEQRPLWQQPPASERAPLPVTSPGGAGGGGEQRPLWQQPPAAERAPLPVISPAIQATP